LLLVQKNANKKRNHQHHDAHDDDSRNLIIEQGRLKVSEQRRN